MATQLDTLFGTVAPNINNNINAAQGLQQFLSLVREQGLATHNNYFVVIDIPPALQQRYLMYGQVLSLLCAGGEFPATNIETKDIFFRGATKPIGVNIRYGEMFLFFYIEQNMTLKTFFDDWFNMIADPVDGIVGFNDDYATCIRIYQLDKEYIPTYGVQLVGAFPKSSFPLQVTAQGSQLHRLPISFSYRFWQNIHINYVPNNDSGFFGNLLSSQGMQLVNKIAPVIYGRLAK